MVPALLLMLATASPVCVPARPATCADTNMLVLSPAFRPRLASFLGRTRGSYLDRDGPVIDQAIEVLHGPPDPPKRLTDGSWLFTACRAHSCPEKGAVALSKTGQVLAFGILSFDCHRAPAGKPRCDDGPSLTLFVPHAVVRAPTAYSTAIVQWARSSAKADQAATGAAVQGSFRGVIIRDVPGEAG